MTRLLPYDEEAERHVIAMAFWTRGDRVRILDELADEDFYLPVHRAVLATIRSDHNSGLERIDRVSVCRRVTDSGMPVGPERFDDHSAVYPGADVETLRDLSLRRRVALAASNVERRCRQPEVGNDELADDVSELVRAATVSRSARERGWDVANVPPIVGRNWLVPGLLERGDRLIVTAAEGRGKSTALRSWGFLLAMGWHPFTFQPIAPLRVLLIDCENSEAQIQRSILDLHRRLDRVPDRDRMRVVTITEGVDLRDPRDYDYVDQLVGEHRADLLILGPLYKIFRTRARESTSDDTVAKEVTDALDRLRARHRCALWMEHHAPHGDRGDRADYRPFGSSHWLRWPEFGRAIIPQPSKDYAEFKPWRGDRDRGREWPDRLIQHGPWPWMVPGVAGLPRLPVHEEGTL